MMAKDHRNTGANYRAQLANVMLRAEALESHARSQSSVLAVDDPQRVMWARIERRYATIRGNAQHLLVIQDRMEQRRKPLFRLRRYLNLL
jgi:hypothetical protein